MITVPDFAFEPVKRNLETDPDVYVVVRPATILDEGRRMDYGFGNRPEAPVIDIMLAEAWLTLVECNIQREGGEPLFQQEMPWEKFTAAATALWKHNQDVFNEICKIVREVNPHWGSENPT